MMTIKDDNGQRIIREEMNDEIGLRVVDFDVDYGRQMNGDDQDKDQDLDWIKKNNQDWGPK